MGSEGPSIVTVHVTGFKKFHGVAENPTEKLVTNIKSFIEKRGLPKNLVLGSCEILETAGQGALGTLYKVLESAIADRENGSSAQGQIIWVHFGVNSGASRFALENQAVNEATFRCPDELGWKPQRVPIVPSDGSISRTRETTLPVKELTNSRRHFPNLPRDPFPFFFQSARKPPPSIHPTSTARPTPLSPQTTGAPGALQPLLPRASV